VITPVFVHGAGCTGEVFAAQSAAFPGSIALTLPGHTTPGAVASIAEFGDFVVSELARRDLSHVLLAGHSMGGAVALDVALRKDPRVAALALLASGSRLRVAPAMLEGLASDFPSTARTLAGYFFADPTEARIGAAVAMMLAVGPEQTRRDFLACNAFDVTDRLGEITVPLLAITGDRDVLTPPKYALAVADRVPGASARILPGAGHLANVEAPGDTNDAIRAFVDYLS